MKKFIVAVLAVLFLGAMGKPDIVIGVSAPLTGQAASYGEQIRDGASVALAEINESGGVLGNPISLNYQDDNCDAKQGVIAANKLVTSGVVGVIGLFCSMSTIPATEIYAEENIPTMFSATSPKITSRGLTNIFRVNGQDDKQTTILAAYMQKNFPGQKIALIHDKQVWGKGMVDYLQSDLAALKIKPAMIDSVTLGEKDFSALIAKLKKEKIGVVMLALFPVEAGLIMRQAADAGYKANFFGGDSILSTEYWNIAGAAGDGLIFTGPADPRTSAEGKKIVAKIKANKGNPELYALYSYTQLKVLAEAMNRAGSLENAKIIKALQSGSYKTVLGELEFDAQGNLKKPLWSLYRWTKGDYKAIDSAM